VPTDRQEGQQWVCGDLLTQAQQEVAAGQPPMEASVLAREEPMGPAAPQYQGWSFFLESWALRGGVTTPCSGERQKDGSLLVLGPDLKSWK
jgi:hypothetical protein